jgi:hypothetical protein
VGIDTLNMSLVTALPDTQTSYVMIFPTNVRHYYGLSSFNRFGDGDTTRRDFIPILPGVAERYGLPVNYVLHQSYPNPFNPTTTIVYELPHEGLVRLEVFDVLGQLVERLIEGNQPAGYYRIPWDAADHPSGVYFYKLSISEFVGVRSMMLVR